MLKIGRVIHRKTKRKGYVVLVNRFKNDCFIFFDKGPQHGEYFPIKEIRNLKSKTKIARPIVVFRKAIRPDFTSRIKGK